MAAIGDPVPALDHAVSVSLPSWDSTVGYEEGAEWVTTKMKNGYPRFLINSEIQALADAVVSSHGQKGQKAMLFPSFTIARQCLGFVQRASKKAQRSADVTEIQGVSDQILALRVRGPNLECKDETMSVYAVMFSEAVSDIVSKFWQHTGEGISSRRARFLQHAFDEGRLKPVQDQISSNANGSVETGELSKSLWPSFKEVNADDAKALIKARIAGNFKAYGTFGIDAVQGIEADLSMRKIDTDDVFLYPTGMSAIFNAHQLLMKIRGPLRSLMFGFPYIDTLKILENFGPGCDFYGQGSEDQLEELERRCAKGERFLALFCEFPGNPLLKTPNLRRIKQLADRFDFAVVVDDTIGNFLNVNVLPSADVVVCSLTKLFSGASNVMGGSLVLNAQSRYHAELRRTLDIEYRDNYWPEDAIVMEQNSRDFMIRNKLINDNAQQLCDRLSNSSIIKEIFYPSLGLARANYDAYRTINGGYGGLISLTFHREGDARVFFDALDITKGPSLGTNFTIASPYVILAHYHELEWAASYGIPASLVRVSVGVEDYNIVLAAFEEALHKAGEYQMACDSSLQDPVITQQDLAAWEPRAAAAVFVQYLAPYE